MYRMIMFALLLVVPVVAQAQQTGTLTPPTLREGQFVYTIPEDFDPPGIGRAGLTEMNEVAAKLHHPFYVVIVDRLPSLDSQQKAEARAKEYTENGAALDAAWAIDRLMEDWSVTNPGTFKIGTTTTFLLSFNPRQYRMLAGTTWKEQLGLRRDTLQKYADPFVRAAKGSPKDPKGGIIRTMQGLDEYVFDQTDPERVKARQEAAIAAAKAKELADARKHYSDQTNRLEGLLNEPEEYLPPDKVKFAGVLSDLKAQVKEDDPNLLHALAGKANQSADVLDEYVSAKKSDARWATFWFTLKLLFTISAMAGAIWWVVRRSQMLADLRARWSNRYAKWDSSIKNAAGMYVSAYADRKEIVLMDDTTGATKTLWDKVVNDVDDIWVGVKGLEDHLAACAKVAARGSFFNLGALRKALVMITEPFDYDTGKVNKDELFNGDTKFVQVVPDKFMEVLSQRFKANRVDWQRLVMAALARTRSAMEMFPHVTMNDIIKACAERNIPEGWYSDHPLAGDDASDKKVWEAAEAIRWTDPIGYTEHIGRLREAEQTVFGRVDRLVKALDGINAVRVKSVPEFKSRVNADEDPSITLALAQDSEHRLVALLTECASNKDIERVEKQVQDIVDAYRKTAGQLAAITVACPAAIKALDKARQWTKSIESTVTASGNRVASAAKVHKGVTGAKAAYDSACDLKEQAKATLEKAEAAMQENWHLAAQRKAEKANDLFEQAIWMFKKAMQNCDALDQEKAEFEAKAAAMKQARERAASRIRQYGGNASCLPTYQPVTLGSGPLDYAVYATALAQQEQEWDRQARRVQQDYEAEQERQRRAEEARREAQRRAKEEEAAARRRASYDSYSSSSSSSWGGGGSDSFGGGFGGGGSSSCGGDW